MWEPAANMRLGLILVSCWEITQSGTRKSVRDQASDAPPSNCAIFRRGLLAKNNRKKAGKKRKQVARRLTNWFAFRWLQSRLGYLGKWLLRLLLQFTQPGGQGGCNELPTRLNQQRYKIKIQDTILTSSLRWRPDTALVPVAKAKSSPCPHPHQSLRWGSSELSCWVSQSAYRR